jgi:hypothetical protein
MNARLQYLADGAIIASLADDITKTAQAGGTMSNIASGVKEYISGLWDPKDPVDSILGFIAPGILSAAGFGWLAFIYEVAEVMGFDFIGFFSSIRQNIKEFIHTLVSSKEPIPQETIYENVKEATTAAAEQHFNGATDMSKLPALAMKAPSFVSELQDANDVRSFAINQTPVSALIKNAGIMSIFKGKLARLFIRMVTWLITTALVSLGFAAAGGTAKSLLGGTPSSQSSSTDQGDTSLVSIAPQAARYMSKIQAKNIPADLKQSHSNNTQNVWIESGNIDEIEQIIMSWIMQAYPQLSKYTADLSNSETMQNIVKLFEKRNGYSKGVDIYAVPKPFTRKLDIVDQIVGAFLNQNPTLDMA